MDIYELKENMNEMMEQLEQLLSSGQLKPDEIKGFVVSLVVGENVGANISKTILDMTIDERCNILSMIGYQLQISPEQFFNFNNMTRRKLISKTFGRFIR